ncbi:hypothetical protein [Variovorax sp. RCC_210]|uniref:hypothetical protein n=1 Tax=Variovorax sp. RCC_210 TaxID=3239217 RepID=UPI003524EFFE
MKSINTYLRENVASAFAKNIHVAPQIDEKRLNNAIKAFGFSGEPGSIIALFDNTLMGSGKDGLLFTGEQLIYRATFADPISVAYAAIESVEYLQTPTGSKNDKIEHSIKLTRKGAGSVSLLNLSHCDLQALAKLLQNVISDFEEFREEQQFVPLDEMSEALKVAYLKITICMAFDTGGGIDAKRFAEILLLMTRLDLSTASRFELRALMGAPSEVRPVAELISHLDAECPPGQTKSLHISLVKDLINLHFVTGGKSIDDFAFLKTHRDLLALTDAEIDLAVAAIRNDYDMLKEDFTDDQIVNALKLLSAKAAAVGTPLTAVYLSGSVIGMSAAGLTSGLATLGMGGLLGLSSMATGIGVAVLIGVGAYTGMRKLTGANELTKSKRRELMLNEVIKQTQATISLLIQDINFITLRLNDLISAHDGQQEELKRLSLQIRQLSNAGAVLTGKSADAQGSATRLRCARFLDAARLKSLTREPTRAKLHDLIIGCYEEQVFVQQKDGKSEEVKKLAIRPELAQRDLEVLAGAFEAIGYFKMADVLAGTAADAAGKAKEKLAGLFS